MAIAYNSSQNRCKQLTTRTAVLIIVFLCIGVYANSLNGSFLWDDLLLIKQNTHIHDIRTIGKIFTQSTGAGAGIPNAYYRPIEQLSYMFDYLIWKDSPIGYHITNIALHTIMCLSIFWLLFFLFENRILSLLATALYATHPTHVEAVAYISGRPEIPAAILMIWCVICYDQFFACKKKYFYLFALISAILAFLARENSIIIPFLLISWHYGKKIPLRAATLMPFFILDAAYIMLRLSLFSFTKNYGSWLFSAPERIPSFFIALYEYIKNLLFPIHLHAAYGPDQQPLTWVNPAAFIGISICFVVFAVLWRKKGKGGITSFCILWFFAAMIPYTNIYPKLPFYMNDHHMYMPSIGFFLLIAYGIYNASKKPSLRKISILITALLIAFYSFLTLRQNIYWRNPVTFFKKTLIYAPSDTRLHKGLADIYSQKREFKKALACYKQAINLYDENSLIYYNMGILYQKVQSYNQAIAAFDKSITLNPDFTNAHNNLGSLLVNLGEYDKAIMHFKKILEINPFDVKAYNNLGAAYALQGYVNKAIPLFEKALLIDPNYKDAYQNLKTANALHQAPQKP